MRSASLRLPEDVLSAKGVKDAKKSKRAWNRTGCSFAFLAPFAGISFFWIPA